MAGKRLRFGTWRGAVLPAAVLTLTAAGFSEASAQSFEPYPAGYYIGAQGGYNLIHNPDLDGDTFNASTDTSGGPVGLFSLGYDYQSPWRAEIEAGYRSNGIDDVESVTATGDIDAFTAMANIYYDFDLDAFSPYVGVGVGAAYLKANSISPVNGSTVDDDDVTFAGQLMIGAAYQVSESVALTGQYTFLAAPQAAYDLRGSGDDVDSEYYSHAFMVGLRYMFGPPSVAYRDHEPALEPPAPPPPSAADLQAQEDMAAAAAAPPPPPPPPPEPDLAAAPAAPAVRNFIIFFDWDSAVITPQAMDVLGEAANYAATGNYAVVTLTGHTDTSGTKTYNKALSERRAAAAKMILVQQGITASAIETSASGENSPLVNTGDNVREAQNRRVEIRIE